MKTNHLAITLAVLIAVAGGQAKVITLFADPLPAENAELVIERNATESFWEVTWTRVNRTTYDIRLSLPARMKADMEVCRANINTCNLTYIREQYVPPQYSISDNTLRMIIGNLTTVPVNALASTAGNKNTIDVLNGDTVRVTYNRPNSRFNIGFGTISTYVPDSGTHPGWTGTVGETSLAWSTRSAMSTACYGNITSSNNFRCNVTGGSTTLDTAIEVNFTMPGNRSYLTSVFVSAEYTSTSASTAQCLFYLRNFTSSAYVLLRNVSCSSAADTTQTFNITGATNLTDLVGNGNRVTLWIILNSPSVNSDNLQADYVYAEVDYDQPAVLNWTTVNSAWGAAFENLTVTSSSLYWNNSGGIEAYLFGGATNCFNLPSTRTNFTFLNNSDGMTVAAWVKTNGTATTTPAVVNTRFNFGSALGQLLQFDSAEFIKFWMGATTITSTGAAASIQQWNHFAAVYNLTSGQVMYYKNGTNTDNQTFAAKNASTSSSYIGCEGASNNVFNGTLDNIYLYNTSLNGDDIKQLYLNRTDVKCEKMRHMFLFNKNYLTCGRDSVGFGS